MLTLKHDPTSRCTHLALVRVAALVSLLLGILLLVLARAGAVQAAGVVTNCSNDSQLIAKLAGGGLVTFNCSLPAPIIITVTLSGGIVVTPNTTLDGSNSGNPITLSGGGTTRLFRHLAAVSALTLTHLTLSDGNAGAGNGGCLDNEAGTAVLEDVTVTHCKTGSGSFGGGGIYNNGTAMLTNVMLNSNVSSAVGGGGIFNAGTLTLNDSTLSGNNSAGNNGGGIDNYAVMTLTNVTLGGNSALCGGGIFNDGTAMLMNSILSGNSASCGGGIDNYTGGTVTLDRSTLSGNSASADGGGIYNYAGGTVTLDRSTLSGNSTSADGGGINNSGGTATLNHSTLSGNSAMKRGGGIYNESLSTLTLDRSTLSGNSASIGGGGIYNNSAGTTKLDDSTLSDNSAGNNGAGLNNSGKATLVNSTLSGNLANHWGGGIYNQFEVTLWNVTLSNNSAATGGALYMESGNTTVLTNTILAYSLTGGNCSGTISTSKYSFSSDNSCALPAGHTIHGQNPNGLDPLLTALGNYGGPTLVHMIKLGSPADAGVVGSDAPTTDQRDLPRPGPDGSYDIGAVQRQPTDSDLAPRLELPQIVR